MLKVFFYTKKKCPACDDAHALLMMLQNHYSFQIEERDIYTDDTWTEKYGLLIPVVQIKDAFLNCNQIDIEAIENVLKENLTHK